jgi:CO dehydrogenase/acetyl-CoA synthase alpha subunit
MRKLFLISLLLITVVGISCNAQTNQKPSPEVSKNGDVEVYYFHMTAHCVTCKTVEAEARKNIEMLYAVSQPQKFTEVMKSKIDPLIK